MIVTTHWEQGRFRVPVAVRVAKCRETRTVVVPSSSACPAVPSEELVTTVATPPAPPSTFFTALDLSFPSLGLEMLRQGWQSSPCWAELFWWSVTQGNLWPAFQALPELSCHPLSFCEQGSLCGTVMVCLPLGQDFQMAGNVLPFPAPGVYFLVNGLSRWMKE